MQLEGASRALGEWQEFAVSQKLLISDFIGVAPQAIIESYETVFTL